MVACTLVVAAAVIVGLVPIDPAWVERNYARTWYATLQPLLTSVSGLLPFALLDVWIVVALSAIAWTTWRLVRVPRGSRTRRWISSLGMAVVVGATIYLVFVVCWGLNYRRLPVTAGLDFDRSRVTAAAIEAASLRAVEQLNRLHQPAHADLALMPSLATMRVRLAPGFAAAQRALGATRLATPGRPKVSMLTPFFRWATVDGMINPLGLEVIVNPDALPFERPFVIAHEWGHLAGWAPESEASYVGWLTCLAGDHAARYSGWLSIYWQLRSDVARERLASIDQRLASGPRQDLAAIAARLRRGHPLIQQATWRTYDQYLKANRVASGVRSYGEVVTLVLGTATDDAGRPRLR